MEFKNQTGGISKGKTIRVAIPESNDMEEVFPKPQIEAPFSKEELIDLYWNKKMSTTKIARELGRDTRTINRWLRRYNIPIRNQKEAALVRWYGK